MKLPASPDIADCRILCAHIILSPLSSLDITVYAHSLRDGVRNQHKISSLVWPSHLCAKIAELRKTLGEPDKTLLLRQHFASSELSPQDAFAGWQQAVAPVFDVAPVDPHAQFAAAHDTYHLGDILVGGGSFDATAFTRSRQKALSDGIDHVMVQVYTVGGYTGMLDDRPITVRRGDLVTLDMARETRTISVASTNITVIIPRELLKVREVPHGHMSQGPRGSV
ncbi:hypothetical protein, partial [Pararhizobium antarcticum]|uniref:hypothetical protein n=1 Tax=Pararhizobium antarcticum TaxID=1798805 RepID=UPI001AECB032